MASNLAVVILAAGSGKRLGGEKQKVVKNILGKPMLSYLMGTVKKLFPDEVFFPRPVDILNLLDYQEFSSGLYQ